MAALNFAAMPETTQRAAKDSLLLELAVRGAVDGFWYWNFVEETGWVSDRWYELMGLPKDGGKPNISSWHAPLHPDDRDRVGAALRDHLKNRTPYDLEFRVATGTDQFHWLRSHGQAEWGLDGRAILMAGSIVDIEPLKRAQLASADLAEQFRALCESSSDGILIVDGGDNTVTYANPAVAHIFGHALSTLQGMDLARLQPSRHRHAHTQGMLRYMATGERRLDWAATETTALHHDGHEFPVEVTFGELQLEIGQRFVAFIRDITRRHENEQRIKYLALHDPLTGLLNRTSIEEKAAAAFALAAIRSQSVALMFVDLDRFKYVNDWLGHAVGDQLLVSVAERIVAALPAHAAIARQGGDEFIVLLEDASDSALTASIAAQLLAHLVAPFRSGEHLLYVGASIGVSVYPRDGDNEQTLLARADAAMYHAKAEGRNRVCFFSDDMSAKAERRVKVEHALRTAIERNQLWLAYQPVYAIDGKTLVSFEALLRWDSPELGSVGPNEFINVAETAGIIVMLGDWVLQNACAQLARWRKYQWPALKMSVNVSARQLLQGDLQRRVLQALTDAQLPADALILELTESSLIEHPDQAARVLRGLADLGVSWSIDDFGTGFSSLSYLKRFPVAQIKIDRSFIADVETDANDAAIVKAVIAMGTSLGLCVVAEGVETAAQAQFLSAHGCHHVQGFWYGHPMAPAAFETDAQR